jgi:hypothetical protein
MIFWCPFDCEFQTPTGLEGHPPVLEAMKLIAAA